MRWPKISWKKTPRGPARENGRADVGLDDRCASRGPRRSATTRSIVSRTVCVVGKPFGGRARRTSRTGRGPCRRRRASWRRGSASRTLPCWTRPPRSRRTLTGRRHGEPRLRVEPALSAEEGRRRAASAPSAPAATGVPPRRDKHRPASRAKNRPIRPRPSSSPRRRPSPERPSTAARYRRSVSSQSPARIASGSSSPGARPAVPGPAPIVRRAGAGCCRGRSSRP